WSSITRTATGSTPMTMTPSSAAVPNSCWPPRPSTNGRWSTWPPTGSRSTGRSDPGPAMIVVVAGGGGVGGQGKVADRGLAGEPARLDLRRRRFLPPGRQRRQDGGRNSAYRPGPGAVAERDRRLDG